MVDNRLFSQLAVSVIVVRAPGFYFYFVFFLLLSTAQNSNTKLFVFVTCLKRGFFFFRGKNTIAEEKYRDKQHEVWAFLYEGFPRSIFSLSLLSYHLSFHVTNFPASPTPAKSSRFSSRAFQTAWMKRLPPRIFLTESINGPSRSQRAFFYFFFLGDPKGSHLPRAVALVLKAPNYSGDDTSRAGGGTMGSLNKFKIKWKFSGDEFSIKIN